MDEKYFLASNNVELSESKSYIELTNLLCYYDAPNENGVQLPQLDALEKAQTLVNMPVVAKYKSVDNKPDLGGHEAYINPVSRTLEFDTEHIGTHTSVEIKDAEVEINGETKTLPCLFATSRIWTQRHKHTIEAIKRLYAEGKLTSSWEISVSGYEFKDGVKILSDYSFDANCLLGSNVLPAYPCASVVDMASLEQSQLMIAEAFTKDKEEDEKVEDEKKIQTEEAVSEEVVVEETTIDEETTPEEETTGTKDEPEEDQTETEEKTQTETSAITDMDLRKALSQACNEANPNPDTWLWVSFVFVDEQKCLCDYCGSTDLEFIQFDYTIADNTVVVSNPENVKLTVSISQINEAISSRDDAILSAKTKITELETQVSELSKYKEICDQIEAEKARAEKDAKIEKLKSMALSSGYITKEEIEENKEISSMVESLDELGIKSLIVDRMLSQKAEEPTPIVETSSIRTDITGEEADKKSVSAFSYFMNLN